MAFQYDDLIGTGETYTTFSAWLTARNLAEAWTGDRRARLKAEYCCDTFGVINADTTGLHWIVLTADFGAEHNGTPTEVSGVLNARIKDPGSDKPFVFRDSENVEVSWLEIQALKPAGTNNKVIYWYNQGGRFHHNIVHSNSGDAYYASGSYFRNNTALPSETHIYRNIFYGSKTYIQVRTTFDGVDFLYNTLGPMDATVNSLQVDSVSTPNSTNVKNNVSFSNTGTCMSVDSDAARSNNATEDASGDAGLINLVGTDQFKNYELVALTEIDLRIKDAAADIYQVSSDYYSTATYPEIDVPISNRNAAIPTTVLWSLGADDIVKSVGDLMKFIQQMV